jgi:hypothetical protein
MNWKKTLTAGAVFAALILATVVLLRSPEKGTRPAGERPRPIPKIKTGDFDTIEVTKGGVTTVIQTKGDGYQIIKPVDYPAEKDAAKAAFESVAKIEFGSLISDQKSRHNDLEVGDGSLRVALKKGDKVLADLHIGKTTNDQTLVRLEGKDDVWAASGLMKYQWDKDTTAWRDKSIARFDEKDGEKIEVDSKAGGRIVLTKPAPSDAGPAPEWRIAESSKKIDPFDKSSANDLISQLSNWQATEFADSAKPEETGLDAPENKVTATLRNGTQIKVLIGKKKGAEDTYVKLADKPQVFVANKYSTGRINKRPVDFRDKTMCNLTTDEITEIAVTRDKDSFVLSKMPGKTGADAWKLSKPAGVTLDTSKVTNILSGFSDWKAAGGYAEDYSPKTTGLAKPSTTISTKSNVKGHACNIKVGNEATDKTNVYVQANGEPDIYLGAKWSVERIAVKLDDLKKK